MHKLKYDLAGQRFGSLTAISHIQKTSIVRGGWLCRCDCGVEKTIRAESLISGQSISCGCRRYEKVSSHRLSDNPLYYIWSTMKQRCNNPNNPSYPRYGGRGIKMCMEWEENFQAFYEWSMDNGYKAGLTIDRIDVNGNYHPSNCRYATMEVQQNNRTNNAVFQYKGKDYTLSELAKTSGVHWATLRKRIMKGMTVDQAVNTPVNISKRNKNAITDRDI